MNNSKFILGTANLGQKYGINNVHEYDPIESENILIHAIKNGVNRVDTSPDYGKAHELLKKNLHNYKDLRITTKISAKTEMNPAAVLSALERTFKEFEIDFIDTVLFHNPDSYTSPQFREITKNLVNSGMVNHVGVSVYNKKQIINSLEESEHLTKFQVPENILDRRLVLDPEILMLSKQGITFEVRSIFLQGLLLSSPKKLKNRFDNIKSELSKLEKMAKELSSTVVDLCLNYAQNIPWSQGTVISAANINQLNDIFNYRSLALNFDILPTLTDEYLDPRKWT